MACRLNLASRNFDKAAENLGRAAQVPLRGEFLRQIVESEGKAVQAAARAGQLPIDWKASDCPALDKEGHPTARSRVYLGSDGVMVPHVTQKEKRMRRERAKASGEHPQGAAGRLRGGRPQEQGGTGLRLGGRWDGDNAESILSLEALEQSGAWDAYWMAQLSLAA